MEIEYNTVKLELLTLDRVERRAVYDNSGTDLLYIEWLIGAACVFNRGGVPVATSTKVVSTATDDELRGRASGQSVRGSDPSYAEFRQTANVIGYTAGGHNGIVTDAEVRARLLTPRRPLRISAYDTTGKKVNWLLSPRPGETVDAANGPHPISCDVIENTGDVGALGVYYQIKTCVSPCPLGSDRFVLSHRWRMSHVHDENFYLTRVIDGTIVFNGAAVAKSGIRPDLVRNQFIHPVPVGYRRNVPEITQSEDGLTIDYRVTDTDPTCVFDPGDSGATKMSIIEKYSYESPWGF